ncbi:MAG: capsular exopolysaccharide family protein [Cyanobacteria bacterium RYN_339]|nr:capsular exopolysaccharide family protein [Cyanobacteria bacterium RYN_339]
MHHSTHEPGLFSLVRRRWRCMGVALAVTVTLGAGAILAMPKTFQATAKLMVTRSEQRMGGLRVVNDALPELTGASHPLYTQVELLRISPVFESVINRLNLRNKDGKKVTVEQLQQKVRITPIDKTDLIEVQYQDDDPGRARQVVDDLCATYIRMGEAYREQGVREGLRYVKRQLETARIKLAVAEKAFQAFKSQASVVDMPQEVQGAVGELSLLNGAIREQESALAGARARAGQLRGRLGMDAGQGLQRLSVSQDPRLKSLKDTLTQAESSPLWSQGLKPEHPEMQALSRHVQQLRSRIEAISGGPAAAGLAMNDVQVGILRDLTSAEAEVRSLESGVGVSHGRRTQLLGQLAKRPGQEVRLRQVTRDLEVASQVYQELLKKHEDAAVALALAPTFARVIQPAVLPDKPLSPVKGPAFPVVAVLGLAAAFGVGATRDLLARPRPDLAAARPMGGLSVLPALPASTPDNPAYERAMEAIASLVEARADGEGALVLGVTSLQAGEGRSTSVVALAEQLAHQGHRVLLVEADFRKPCLAERQGLDAAAPGFGEVLLEGRKPAEVVRKAGEIDVVTAGPGLTASLVRLVKRRVAPAIAAWQAEYDFVLLDLPPLASLERVPAFGRAVDGLLLLVNHALVSSDQLLTGLGRLQDANLPLLGVLPVRAAKSGTVSFETYAGRRSQAS